VRGKQYFITLATVYLCYITQGVQSIIINLNFDNFMAQFHTDAASIYGITASFGLAKLLTAWLFGEISDRVGRRKMVYLGAVCFLIYFGGLMFSTSIAVMNVCGFCGGVATSILDGSTYPAAQESWPAAPGSAVILIKASISFSGLLFPLIVVALNNAGIWKVGVAVPIVMSMLIVILATIAPFSYDVELKERKAKKAAGTYVEPKDKFGKLDADAQKAAARFIKPAPKFVVVGCALYGFIAMATMWAAMQLVTRLGKAVLGMSDLAAAGMTSIFTAGSLIAVLFWAVMMAKFRWRALKILLIDLFGTVISYAVVCFVPSIPAIQAGCFGIGFFAAGGAMQCGVVLMQEFHPASKGRNLGIYYTFMGLASFVVPTVQKVLTASVGEAQGIMNNLLFNLCLAVIGLLFMIYLVINYKTWFGVSAFSKKELDEIKPAA
jgi:MFS family permease